MKSPRTLLLLPALALGCGTSAGPASPDAGSGGGGDGPLARYAPCPADTRVGGFEVRLADGFTAVQGQVADAVTPYRVPTEVRREGDCALYRPPVLFCDPACGGGTTCGLGGLCVPQPAGASVGEVELSGLAGPVSLSASAPVWFYAFRGDLPHPGMSPGADVRLTATGGLALKGWGIEALSLSSTTARIERGRPVALEWRAAAAPGPSRVRLELSIANHGGTPAWVECHTEDDGRIELPTALTDALLDLGFSGFPTVTVARRSVDAQDHALGCVELELISETVLDVEIPGLVSCSTTDDCPPGQTCQPDLTCG